MGLSPSPSKIRTRKKHKRLDAISEVVFNQNRNVEIRLGEGEVEGEGVDSVENDDSGVRRSFRVRKAPMVLDSSPPPARKRRMEGFGRGRGGGSSGRVRGKGKGRVKNERGGEVVVSSEEELGAWRSKSRSGVRGSKTRRKRKLFEDDEEEDEKEVKVMKDESEEDDEERKLCKNDDELDSRAEESGGGLPDVADELDVGGSKDKCLENGINSLNEEDSSCIPSTSARIDLNVAIMDDSPHILSENEKEAPKNAQLEESGNGNENQEESNPSDGHDNISKCVGDAETQLKDMEVAAGPSDLAENGQKDMKKDLGAVADMKQGKHENVGKAENGNVTAGGIRRSRVKEGRRCGLCGGGIDGKPPKRLITNSDGSDHEEYSGSSGSEEYSYDAWDGFGDESGWLGKLLGPINDRYGIAGIWVHQHCAVWSPEVYFAGLGCLKNIRAALVRGRALKCTRCGKPGATLGCRVDRCPRTYHLPCARASGCNFDHRKFLIACADHRYLFEPHGLQYAQRLKKLKAKKMKFEIRKLSNDASRKDLEAEEKWLEKCGEDEEFLRRESKRLQRDLLRIAPVYIGGSHSEGESPFGGWDSVGGLQNVIQCLKEVVILPLLYPEFYANMGITPPRGVLLHGYPGTGKTLVVRSLIGSCARGDKRIAYFARKGADCLGKYVGDAERQLRLLFQVAERSQPSIIFFDEIDGLAPVRTRQQDQTHSSVVSTLLALMDGLKCRGSVVVIGATNRPDSVDPALRRPGRFDREIYFPLPSLKDRAAILALHTRKWPKPVAGPLLDWVASKTVGFAGADLQALCSQVAVIALKRNCSWNQILSCASDNVVKGRRPQLPSFLVEERDWLEALSLAPPPCSRREAGMAANEVVVSPLDVHLIPCLLRPLLCLIISLSLDDRLWLPHHLVKAGMAIKKAVASQMEENLQNDKWWSYAQHMVQDANIISEIVRSLISVGIINGGNLTGLDVSEDISVDDDRFHQRDSGENLSGLFRNIRFAPPEKTGYRILIAGAPRCGQKHLASCLLHCYSGNVEMQKIDLATISQEGHGDMEQGISRILMRCTSLKKCVIFMPRIDLWALEALSQIGEQDVVGSPCCDSLKEGSLTSSHVVGETHGSSIRKSEFVGDKEPQNYSFYVSQAWKSFREQLECICVSSSLIILATSELPSAALPCELHNFFGRQALPSEGSLVFEYRSPRFCVDIDGEFNQEKLIQSSVLDLSRNLIQRFVQIVHLGSHISANPSITNPAHFEDQRDVLTEKIDIRSAEQHGVRLEPTEDIGKKLSVPSATMNMKEKSTLAMAITSFGYQVLRYPHFAELCWVTSKLNEGPSADICGPWKGWPFNMCIVRPSQLTQKDVLCNSNYVKGKNKFTLVRGLVAVGLFAYRGIYKTSREVSVEVRKVLELLVGQIGAKIHAGKDRCQYIRLLSQVAYLEDMVSNWCHSLKSFEPDDSIVEMSTMRSKLGGAQTSEIHQAPTAEPLQVDEKPCIDCQRSQLTWGDEPAADANCSQPANSDMPAANTAHFEQFASTQDLGFQEQVVGEGCFQGSSAGSSCRAAVVKEVGVGVVLSNIATETELSPMKTTSVDHMDIIPAEEVANEDVQDKVALASIAVSSADIKDPTVTVQECSMISSERISMECETLRSKDVEDPTVIQVVSSECSDQQMPGDYKVGSAEICGSTEPRPPSSSGPAAENEHSAEAEKNETQEHLPGFNLSSGSFDISANSEIVCCYSCCVGCIGTLDRLLKKIITLKWKQTGSSCTVEDIHDVVSSLATTLCSAIRNLNISEECESPITRETSSGISEKMKSQDSNACQCRTSYIITTKFMDCICHSEDHLSEEFNPSSLDLPDFHPRYFFRDGVLLSADPDKNSSFHCKYETICLGSLIELISSTHEPLDSPCVETVRV